MDYIDPLKAFEWNIRAYNGRYINLMIWYALHLVFFPKVSPLVEGTQYFVLQIRNRSYGNAQTLIVVDLIILLVTISIF